LALYVAKMGPKTRYTFRRNKTSVVKCLVIHSFSVRRLAFRERAEISTATDNLPVSLYNIHDENATRSRVLKYDGSLVRKPQNHLPHPLGEAN